MYDRLPPQRQEHAGAELPLSGRAVWRADSRADDGHCRANADGGYAVDTVRTGSWRPENTARTITAEQVVFAAGTWGTQQLLHRMKADNILPHLSDRLGELTRTHSEAL